MLLATSILRTGGATAVIASQAHFLREAGYRVTVVSRSEGSDLAGVPPGVIFREQQIDLVIDHQIPYTLYWPEDALATRGQGATTVGWIHNFIGRPIYAGNQKLMSIEQYSNTLAQLVTLSPLDLAYFNLCGVHHTA